MSGVLQRMAQRARSALPAIEPRREPMFAPTLALTDPAIEGIDNGFSGLEEIVDPLDRPSAKTPRRPRQPSVHAEETADLNRLRALQSHSVSEEPVAAHDEASSREALQVSQPASPQGDGDRNAVREVPKPERRTPSGVTEVSSEPQPMRATPEERFSASDKEEEEERLRPAEALAARLPAFTFKSQPPDELKAGGQAATLSQTEIHISIGSIELRAARSEPRPQAPAFRPRVSLDEFLRRRS